MSKLIVLAALGRAGCIWRRPRGARGARPAACAAHPDVVKKARRQLRRDPQRHRLHKNDTVVEVFSSATTGSWTIVMTEAGGMSCLFACGAAAGSRVRPPRGGLRTRRRGA